MFIKRGGASAGVDFDHQTLLALINNLSDAVLALDANLNISLVNGAALDLLDRNELKGLAVNQVVELLDKTGAPADLAALLQASPNGQTNRDLRLRLRSGSLINVYVNLAPVRRPYGSAGSGGYILIIRDITSEKMREEERDDFINVASHELRSPVAVAEGGVSNAMLLAERGGASENVMQSLKMAHDQVLFLGNMINDLSVLARADRGKLAMTIANFSVAELVNELANGFRPQAEKKNLSLSIEISDDAGELTSSRLYVGEILQNLVTNSIKYTQSGGIKLSAARADNGTNFTISDTGIGISPADQAKLFTKFFRSDDERVKQEHGTGLGLYIIAKLVKLLEARLEINSELNKGTSFNLYFPNLQLPEPPPTNHAPPPAAPLANS